MKNSVVDKLKLIIVLIVSILLLIIGTGFITQIMASDFQVDQEKCVFEYGDDVNPHLSHYLTGRKKDKVLKHSKFIFNVPNQIGCNYPKVGYYTALVKYDGKLLSFRVEVKDTILPEFVDFKSEVDVPVGTTYDELVSMFHAYDLSGAKIIIESDDLNLNEAGSYLVTVIAKDPYDNMISRTCEVNVVDNRHGLANAGEYVDSDGNIIYFEEYYNKADAEAARANKLANNDYNVSNVFETSYKGDKVYRFEWSVKKQQEHKEEVEEEKTDQKDDSDNDIIYPGDNSDNIYYPTPTPDVTPPTTPDITPQPPTTPDHGNGGDITPPPTNPDHGNGGEVTPPTNPDHGNGGEVTPPQPNLPENIGG